MIKLHKLFEHKEKPYIFYYDDVETTENNELNDIIEYDNDLIHNIKQDFEDVVTVDAMFINNGFITKQNIPKHQTIVITHADRLFRKYHRMTVKQRRETKAILKEMSDVSTLILLTSKHGYKQYITPYLKQRKSPFTHMFKVSQLTVEIP